MKKTLIFIFVCMFIPALAAAQKNPARVVGALTATKAPSYLLKPLSSQAIEAMVARGKTGLVLRRALGVAQQKNDPIVSILKDGEVNRVLLEQAWKATKIRKYREEEGNMLGLNSWLIVLCHRIREGIKLSLPTLRLLEKELLFAQRAAEEEFQKRFKYSRGNTSFETDPAFLSLLGESVAQRLETGFMPMLSTADRVRLLKVLMHGVFAGPVDWGELHTAVLFREIREALKECSPSMDHVELYGEMKKTLQECARQAAQEAASHSIVSPVLLRGLFIDELKHFSPRFFENGKVMKEWDRLIKFFQQKQPPHAR